MLRPKAFVAGVVLSVVCAASPQGRAEQPADHLYRALQGKMASFNQLFADERVSVGGHQTRVLMMVGDIGEAFGGGANPLSAILPTNTRVLMDENFPVTQRILRRLLQQDPPARKRFDEQVAALRRAKDPKNAGIDLLSMTTEPFVVRLDGGTRTAKATYPDPVCLLATDFIQGGSIHRLDLFQQSNISIGVAGCLTMLDSLQAMSVVLPLVGSASFATRTVSCRLANDCSWLAGC